MSKDIRYNLLNLPREIEFAVSDNSFKVIRYTYTAGGQKLSQQLMEDAGESVRRDYAGPFVYVNDTLALINTPHGRIINRGVGSDSLTLVKEFHIRDHLGNTRVVLEETGRDFYTPTHIADYYPFGMEIRRGGIFYPTPPAGNLLNNRYLYNGKEFQDDFGLNWYDYGARFYDPQIARWHSVDPDAEYYRSWSPYNYVRNNPILRLDPNGRWDVTVHLYNQRSTHGYGVAIVTDRHGNEVHRFNVRAEGSAGRNRMQRNSDTPLGVYNIPENHPWITGGDRAAYGPNARLNMTPVSGEIVESGQAVDNPSLQRTHGCLRALDSDMASFQEITNSLQANDPLDTPGQVTILDNLQREVSPANPQNNMIEINVRYNVPSNELQDWRELIRNFCRPGIFYIS